MLYLEGPIAQPWAAHGVSGALPAIAEAVERKNMRFVPINTDDQLDLQGIHRVRDRLICRRTAVINQIRGFLLERGMVFAQRPAHLKAAMADLLRARGKFMIPLLSTGAPQDFQS